MLGLTNLGAIHTAISLVAVGAGIASFVRDKEIVRGSTLGKVYIWTTVATCVTGFGIFQHGGFGKPHALGVLTLLVLALVEVSARTTWLGATSRYVVTVGLTLTFLFHMIPAMTETFTRLPAGAPWFTGPEDPALAKLLSVFVVAFLVGATLQVRRLRSR